jgi:hypothetical protein
MLIVEAEGASRLNKKPESFLKMIFKQGAECVFYRL